MACVRDHRPTLTSHGGSLLTSTTSEPSLTIPAFTRSITRPRRLSLLIERMEDLVVGQRPLLERLVIALLAGGHVLIEGVPGLAKTRAVRALAQALDLPFRRIQFTPDLLPADLTGTQIYRPATGTFDVRPGPIVTSVLLADEINRAPAKVQSALLEAMQEGQITVGDETIALPETFWVLATQNPIEHEGTYPLPEAQLDRFLMKLVVGYPDRAAELPMLDLPSVSDSPRPDSDSRTSEQPPLYGPGDVIEFRGAGRVDPDRAGHQGIHRRPGPRHARPGLVRSAAGALAGAGGQPARDHRPGAGRPRPRPARRPRFRDASRRQEPGPRHHAPSHPGQLRGRRRGPLTRRHPPAHPRPHSGPVIRSRPSALPPAAIRDAIRRIIASIAGRDTALWASVDSQAQ